jgi:formylglycine-generating enzyme required for sulfatase activity
MALVHAHRGLPDTRAQLYEDTVDMLLHRWDEGKTGGEQPLLRQLLARTGFANTTVAQVKTELGKLAYEVHGAMPNAEEDTLADIQEKDLAEALRGLHRDKSHDWAYKVIGAIKERSGLLLERKPGVYAFPHRTFQEYLAGAHLSTLEKFVEEACRHAAEGPVWREAILLAAGRLAHGNGQYWQPLGLVGELCPRKAGETDAAWRNVWLAGDVLLEIGGESVTTRDMGDELLDRVRCRLVDLLHGGHLSPVERARAGDTLAELGDPRFRNNPWCLPDEDLLGFVEIPAGPFLMGSDPQKDKYAQKEEQRQHPVELPTYYMARYPVTVAQFRTFVDLEGYRWEGKDYSQGAANHPIVSVSWYDAIAYCKWLTEELQVSPRTPPKLAQILKAGGCVTLPSEAEWEKAARGVDGQIYPWKGEFDSNNANTEETGIGRTSAVGCFPSGQSPDGILDMSGNIWEWTRSLWGERWQEPKFTYPYDPTDARREDLSAPNNVLRVLRGCAFWGDLRLARCACRSGTSRTSATATGGFRVVVLPKNSGL